MMMDQISGLDFSPEREKLKFSAQLFQLRSSGEIIIISIKILNKVFNIFKNRIKI